MLRRPVSLKEGHQTFHFLLDYILIKANIKFIACPLMPLFLLLAGRITEDRTQDERTVIDSLDLPNLDGMQPAVTKSIKIF